MPGLRRVLWLLVAALVGLTGCAQNSMVLEGQLKKAQQQQLALSNQQQQLQQRADALDRENQDLQRLLAQTRQQGKISEDQVTALRDQLRWANTQVNQLRTEKDNQEKQVAALTASMKRRGGVSISPNSSYLRTLPQLNLPPGFVRRDGDVIRIALPGNQLFASGGAQLQPAASGTLMEAANEILRLYPDQIIGVEGYTDSDPVVGGQWRDNHHLSVARATAVYDVLVTRTALRPDQLFVVGHGANHPIASNATPAGKEANRRVELVVYPERRQ